MSLGGIIRETVLALAEPRAYTVAMATYDPSAALGSAAISLGEADGLLLRASGGLWDDDGTVGSLTERACAGLGE